MSAAKSQCCLLTIVVLNLLFFVASFSLVFLIFETTDGENVDSGNFSLPFVVVTWSSEDYQEAINEAWHTLSKTDSAVEAVISGCSTCEKNQCDFTVGFGGKPDETGETTLDAMIMDGISHSVGAVGGLRKVKSATRVAHHVMKYTKHTFLVGDAATQFAIDMGFQEETLQTNLTTHVHDRWLANKCQPNHRKNVIPDPGRSCGPYRPISDDKFTTAEHHILEKNTFYDYDHDTVGIAAFDRSGNVAVGTSTNGLRHKVAGRVGDSPIAGAGAYADNDVGGAVATGNGDVMMRFLPRKSDSVSFLAVEEMRRGRSPTEAAEEAISRIQRFYPNFSGAVIAANKQGKTGAACSRIGVHQLEGKFTYLLRNADGSDTLKFITVDCIVS